MPPAKLSAGIWLSLVLLIAGCGSSGDGGGATAQEPPPTSPGPPDPPDPPGDPDPDPAPTAGLDARPSNTTCIAPARATGSASISTERVFPNLSFRGAGGASRNPLQMLRAPGDRSRWFVVERFGTVKVFDDNPAVSTSSMFLDIGARVESSCAECGLLGMAFHPDFPTDRRAYLVYTSVERGGSGPDTHLSEFTTPDGGLTLNPASERVIMTIEKNSVHHHGGGIIFNRDDGYLYFVTGDGNSGNHAQVLTTLLGKVLRIDVDGGAGGAPYGIPDDNPFADNTALCNVDGTGPQNCPEIWAWGLRNPWRWSFDRDTGDLWLGDVGQRDIEEVNRVVRGGNYGWRCLEGTEDSGLACGTPVGPLLPPIAQYTHEFGQAVTGGYVYRGSAYPNLFGQYLFADFVSGRIWSVPNDTAPTVTVDEGYDSGINPSSFAEDLDGELYVVNMRGDLHRIVATSDDGGSPGVAEQLSATGCVSAADPTAPASGLIPYTPTAPFWSDGAAKQRWIGLPDGQNIVVGDDGDWDFPNGTVLMKNFRLDDRLVETRLFMRHPDGIWAGYSYEWNEQGTDATLVRGGKRVTIGSHTWIYPSEAQCMQCHTEAAGRSLGLETKQLASNITYPQTGREGHQLFTLNSINTLAPPLADPAAEVPYPDPTGTTGTLGERARSYLHTNCSQCHRPNGPTTSNMDLRYSTPLANTNACDAAPGLGDLEIADARLIAPGAADRSVIPARMSLRNDPNAMPPTDLGARVDTQGVALIREWIDSLASCD